jgi:hypothetical protein
MRSPTLTPSKRSHPAPVIFEAAITYARLGWHLLPIWGLGPDGSCACHDPRCTTVAKHPLGRLVPHGLLDASGDEDELSTWFEHAYPEANLAVATGAVSNLVVLDADGGAGLAALRELDLPSTWRARTGRGEHVFFSHPGVPTQNRTGLKPGLDVRGDGGYVILPPSRHRSGDRYRWIVAPEDAPLAPLPASLLALLVQTSPVSRNGIGTDHAVILEGERNEVLYRESRALRARGLSSPAILAAVLAENETRCRPPLPEDEIRGLVDHASRQPDRPANTTLSLDHKPVPAGDPSPSPVLLRLADVASESVSWAWPGRLAYGKLTLVIGDPGVGKSYFAADLEGHLTAGRDWPDAAPCTTHHDVVVLSAEDGLQDTLRPRLERQQGDPARVHVLQAVQDSTGERPFQLGRDLPTLERALQATGARYVRIDPLSAYLGKTDSHKDADVRGLLAPLATLAARYHAVVVGILHMTKDNQRRLIARAAGSIAFAGAPRIVLAIGTDPNDETRARRLVVTVKNNLGPEAPALAFRITSDGLCWVDGPPLEHASAEDLLDTSAVPATRDDAQQLTEAQRFLERLLADGPVASTQIFKDAKANAIAERTLWRAKRTLQIAAVRIPPSRGAWFWSLP